jgi:hypothetical protein
VTLGGAATGADTTLQFCNNLSQVETCYDTQVSPDANWHNLEISSPSAAQINFSLDHAAATTFCAVGCTVSATPANSSGWQPAFEVVSNTASTAEYLYLDFWRFKAMGLNF